MKSRGRKSCFCTSCPPRPKETKTKGPPDPVPMMKKYVDMASDEDLAALLVVGQAVDGPVALHRLQVPPLGDQLMRRITVCGIPQDVFHDLATLQHQHVSVFKIGYLKPKQTCLKPTQYLMKSATTVPSSLGCKET